MEWASEDNLVEKAVDIAAAAVFAGSVGFAAGTADLGAVSTICAAVAASCAAFTVLRKVPIRNRDYYLTGFEPVPLETGQEVADELVLNDVLESAAPDARVIRLFDPGGSGRVARPNSPQPDASQALTDALAELRRSLR